jgi:hypothetical protein
VQAKQELLKGIKDHDDDDESDAMKKGVKLINSNCFGLRPVDLCRQVALFACTIISDATVTSCDLRVQVIFKAKVGYFDEKKHSECSQIERERERKREGVKDCKSCQKGRQVARFGLEIKLIENE